MIYQMEIFYGALLNGQAIYSMSTKLDNCAAFPKKEFNEDYFKESLINLIKEKGDDPNNYQFGYLTKEQYENRFDIENEDVEEIKVASDNKRRRYYLGYQQIIDDLRSKGCDLCDMDFIPYIKSLEDRYTKDKGNKYDYIMNKCLSLKNREWVKEEWYES